MTDPIHQTKNTAEGSYYWRGRDIETMNRDELLAALRQSIKHAVDNFEFHKRASEMRQLFREKRHAE